jgi:hypothetical protein
MIVAALAGAGLFTVALGLVHIVIPHIMDFDHAIPPAAVAPTPLRTIALGRLRYQVLRSDVRGIAWVMSNAASYVLITLGIADLAAASWIGTNPGRLVALWATGWWVLRAGGQLLLGHRRGDLAVAAWFAILGAIHAVAAIA